MTGLDTNVLSRYHIRIDEPDADEKAAAKNISTTVMPLYKPMFVAKTVTLEKIRPSVMAA